MPFLPFGPGEKKWLRISWGVQRGHAPFGEDQRQVVKERRLAGAWWSEDDEPSVFAVEDLREVEVPGVGVVAGGEAERDVDLAQARWVKVGTVVDADQAQPAGVPRQGAGVRALAHDRES